MKPVLILQNCHTESAGSILEYLQKRRHLYRLFRTDLDKQWPDPADHRAVICLSCPHPASRYHEQDRLSELYRLVDRTVRLELPYLGICFGGQMLAMILGGSVTPAHTREIGVYRVTLTPSGERDPLFSGFPRSFSVFHWHADTFSVPAGAELLVEGNPCPRQAFRKGKAVGLLYHLEATIDNIPAWCETYPHELAAVTLTQEQLISDFAGIADDARALNFLFLDNFLKM